ncbi:hypothetical protein, variant 2 [Aphanomyces astaci]|uniref:Uncharacterized protein n=1 Tax=Aphanomyces astaci TaxID=112090 RepID=W4G9Q5_APHAT|nr:hypothetical protein, variant 2 [Aphanomyces astaci]ETV76432.1 hypothetical protein, variant 2 [Aphanomyces astaci]|eukprot:XP_009833976.1 hypothetical protein, variant 2 [Aphanomyces astaci]
MSLHIPASANLPLAPHTVQSAREILSHQCSIMIALSVLSLLFMYNVWWMSLFTIVVASVGYYAAEMIKESTSASSLMSGDALGTVLYFGISCGLGYNYHSITFAGRSFQVGSPKLRSKRQLVLAEFFYYASILVAAFQCGGEAMMMVSMSLDMSFSPTNGWEVACMLLGSVFAIALVYTTYHANMACQAFLEERRLHPSHQPLLPTSDLQPPTPRNNATNL